MREGAEACETCKQRRHSRIETWEKNPGQTIWMDEIADHNRRVALLVGKFGLDGWLSGDLVQTMLVKAVENTPDQCVPKNPSHARLRRVWETCQRFWTETVEQAILAKHVYGTGTQQDADLRRVRWLLIPDKKTGWQEDIPYDGTVNGKPISLLWRAQSREFITVINLQLTGKFRAGQVVTVSDPGNPRRTMTFTAQSVAPATDRLGEYMPYLPLLASPDQFLALVPAADALEIADKIRTEYQKQFSKVQNRLPLFLGLVFFPRKMPLMAVMDTARRMLNSPLGEERWKVAQAVFNGQINFTNSVLWNMQTVMDDQATPDDWYPYFFVTAVNPHQHKHRFQLRKEGDNDPQKVGSVNSQYADRWLVHVNDLQAGDTVFVTPSHFAYLFLESTAQRFAFDPQKNLTLLDDLPHLMGMWKAICKSPDMTDTKLRAIHALFEIKLREWKLGEPTSEHPITDDTFRHLVEITLRRDNVQGIAVEDVLNGRFRRCIDLYRHILNRRVSDEKKQEEQHEQQTV
jgi:hypothetical protein